MDFIIAIVYIPPINSTYFKDTYFSNLELIRDKFKDYKLLFIGDMNSRVGNQIQRNGFRYTENADLKSTRRSFKTMD